MLIIYGYAGLFWNPNGIYIKLIAAQIIVKSTSGQLEVFTCIRDLFNIFLNRLEFHFLRLHIN